MKKIILGIGGSSGSIYAQRLMTKLSNVKEIEVGVVMTANAKINWEIELGTFTEINWPFKFYENKDFFAPFASGSANYGYMVVCPCSMGIIGRIASGISDDLMTRSADVILKERRRLILVPRETPYNLIHLKNMTALTETGTIICPASPSFYSKPQSIENVVDTVVDRIIDLLQIEQNTYRWGK